MFCDTRMLRWKSKICKIMNSSIGFYLFSDHSFKYLTTEDQNSKRKENMQPWIKKKKTSVLCLKIEIILVIISYKTFNLHHSDNDVLWSFFQLQNKWITRNLKEGGYIALNTHTNTSMLCLKIEINLIIISYKTFYLYHTYNDVLWSFFQIKNRWRTRK